MAETEGGEHKIMSLINKVKARVRCEVYPCKGRAEYSIGNRRQTSFLVCGEHLRQIVEEGAVMLEENGKEDLRNQHNEETEGEAQILDTADKAGSNETTEDKIQSDDDNLDETAAINEEVSADETQTIAPYNCKHCGEPFQTKPELMTHSKICPKRPPKKG